MTQQFKYMDHLTKKEQERLYFLFSLPEHDDGVDQEITDLMGRAFDRHLDAVARKGGSAAVAKTRLETKHEYKDSIPDQDTPDDFGYQSH